MPKPKVLTISTNKGGAGKTTTAVHLAAGLARDNRRVLLVDLDKQGHCATFLGRDPAPRLYDLLVKERALDEVIIEVRPNLHLLASNSETLVAQDFARLRNAQADLLEHTLLDKAIGYDFVIFDTPPQGLLQECAIYSADFLIVPCPVDYPGMDGAAQFVQVVQKMQQREGVPPGIHNGIQGAPIFVIPMFVDMRTSESKFNLTRLRERFGDQVTTPVPARTRMREAIADGATIFEYAPGEDIGEVYMSICRTIQAAGAALESNASSKEKSNTEKTNTEKNANQTRGAKQEGGKPDDKNDRTQDDRTQSNTPQNAATGGNDTPRQAAQRKTSGPQRRRKTAADTQANVAPAGGEATGDATNSSKNNRSKSRRQPATPQPSPARTEVDTPAAPPPRAKSRRANASTRQPATSQPDATNPRPTSSNPAHPGPSEAGIHG